MDTDKSFDTNFMDSHLGDLANEGSDHASFSIRVYLCPSVVKNTLSDFPGGGCLN